MATHSTVLAWRIPGMGESSVLLSMGSHRVRHDWSDLAAGAAYHTKRQCCTWYRDCNSNLYIHTHTYILTHYFIILPNSFISTLLFHCCFCFCSLGYSTNKIMSSVNTDNYFFLLNWYDLFFFFSFLLTYCTSSLNTNDESFFCSLKGKVFHF